MFSGIPWAPWLIFWCWTALFALFIHYPMWWPYACSAVKKFLESRLAAHIGCLADGWLFLLFYFELFGRKCQNLLFMFRLPGTVAQNVWFNLRSPPALAERKSEQPKLKSSVSFKTGLGQLTKCTDRHPTNPYRLLFSGTVYNFHLTGLFVVESIWLQLMHLLPMCTKMTLYNYSIISLYSIHGSTQSSYKNKNVSKM